MKSLTRGLITVMLVLPINAAGQVSTFRGSWIGRASDSTISRRVFVDGLHIRVSQACLPDPSVAKGCEYEGAAAAYGSLLPEDSAVSALVVRYSGPGWNQLLVLHRPEGDSIEAFIYTSFPGAKGKRSTYEHQVLSRRREHAARKELLSPPPPVPPMPQFPWPPPRPTATLRLPDSLVAVPGHDALGAVFDRLRDALRRVDVGWWSVYAIGDDGFAVVTKMETIDADGRPKPGTERWSGPNDQVPPHFSGIGDYLKALFSARPGFYRIIVLAVTDRPSSPTGDGLSAARAEAFVTGGSDQLPGSLRGIPLGTDGRCLALIYEFERPTEGDSARLVTTAAVGALQHLTLAGLWTERQLRK